MSDERVTDGLAREAMVAAFGEPLPRGDWELDLLARRVGRELLRLRERVAELERERDEHIEHIEAFEDAVRENLPEVTCDSDGNLESEGICRIEAVGFLFREQAAQLARAREVLAKCRNLFTEIRGDWTDPRADCREGWRVIDAALSAGEGEGDTP